MPSILFVAVSQSEFRMENEEKLIFVLFPRSTAILHAMFFDGSSGGVCRIGVITKDGIDREVFFAPEEPLPAPTPSVVTSLAGVA